MKTTELLIIEVGEEDAVMFETTYNIDAPTVVETQFLTKLALWTEHCGIISFNPDISLTQISTLGPEDRATLAPFYVLDIYALADKNTPKTTFYELLLTIPS